MEISDHVLYGVKKYPSVIDAIIFSFETQYHLRGRGAIQVHR